MHVRPAAAALFLALCTQSGIAEQRTATLGISARVVRSCAVQTSALPGTPVRLTCSRDATPGVMTGTSSAVTPVVPMRTTSLQPIDLASAPVTVVAPSTSPAAFTDAEAVVATVPPGPAVPMTVATPPEATVRAVNDSPPDHQPVRQVLTINF